MPKLPKEVSYLLDKIYSEDIPTIKRGKKLKIGNLFLYGYDPKTKAKLPYYDVIPLVVLLGFKPPYMLGINLHYIPYTFRINFAKEINRRKANGKNLKYKDVKKAWDSLKIPGAYARLAVRLYLISHIQTNIKVFEGEDDWQPVVSKVLPDFQKASNSEVIKDIQEKFKEHKKKLSKKDK